MVTELRMKGDRVKARVNKGVANLELCGVNSTVHTCIPIKMGSEWIPLALRLAMEDRSTLYANMKHSLESTQVTIVIVDIVQFKALLSVLIYTIKLSLRVTQ